MRLDPHAVADLQGLVPRSENIRTTARSGYILALEAAFNNWEASAKHWSLGLARFVKKIKARMWQRRGQTKHTAILRSDNAEGRWESRRPSTDFRP